MKKWLCLFLTGAFIFSLSACHRNQNTDTPSDAINTNSHISSSDVLDDTKPTPTATDTTPHMSPSDATEETGTDPNKENPYAIREITDETVVITENKKLFNNSQIALSVPSDWKCLTASGDDNVAYYFQDAMMGEKCQLYIDVTFTYYYKERTQDEYLESLSRSYENVVIDSFTTDNIYGFPCAKAVFSYTKDNTKFVGIRYVNLIEGPRLYYFSITYPAAERDTYETVFDSIIDTIQFMQTK